MAGKTEKITLSLINEGGVIFYGECKALFVPVGKETIAIMANHTPLIAKVSEGDVAVQENRKRRVISRVKSGLLYVADNEVTVLVNL